MGRPGQDVNCREIVRAMSRRRVFLLRKVWGPRVGVRGTIGFAWAKEMAAEVLTARLSRSSRGR